MSEPPTTSPSPDLAAGRDPGGRGADPGPGEQREAAWLTPYRDDGPVGVLVRRLTGERAVLPVPGVLLLAAAVGVLAGAAASAVLAGAAATTSLSSLSSLSSASSVVAGQPWVWATVALVLAVLSLPARSLARLEWPVPALLRAVEYGTVLLLAGAGPWAYLLLATLAARHYDIVYRVRTLGTAPSAWLEVAGGGWPLRSAVLIAGSAVGQAELAVTVMALVLAPMVVVDAVVGWRRSGR